MVNGGDSGPCTKNPHVGWYALGGFLFGYFILHPLSMAISRWLDPAYGHGMPAMQNLSYWETFFLSFHPSMFGMGGVYGLLTGSIAAVIGRQQAAIKSQRDRLRDRNERLSRLEQANRRAAQFMVHNLKTNLGCIVGFSELLLEKGQSRHGEDETRKIRLIHRQARRAADDIARFLEMARLKETGRIERQRVSVPNLLRRAASAFALPEHENRVGIGENSAHCPPLPGDVQLLERVLVNLISNALEHNGTETRVVVDAEFRPSQSDVLFSCKDDGDGIAPEMLPDIFKDFSGEATPGRPPSGLGLAFCKTAVEAHEGKIWCESVREQGTSFYFTIPMEGEMES